MVTIFNEFDLPWVIVGATARDLVLHHGYGAKIQRATRDVDFAVEVADWETFGKLKTQLLEEGFKESTIQHRLVGSNGETIDIVPFGGVEKDDSTILWPPQGEIEMNVLGFSEACKHAEQVIISSHPELVVPVATPIGMIILKLIAWTVRSPELRMKDALDIHYILENYEEIPGVKNELYDQNHSEIMEEYEWDLTIASAHQLGIDARKIANKATQDVIGRIALDQIPGIRKESLIYEMTSKRTLDTERNTQLLNAFFAGFNI